MTKDVFSCLPLIWQAIHQVWLTLAIRNAWPACYSGSFMTNCKHPINIDILFTKKGHHNTQEVVEMNLYFVKNISSWYDLGILIVSVHYCHNINFDDGVSRRKMYLCASMCIDGFGNKRHPRTWSIVVQHPNTMPKNLHRNSLCSRNSRQWLLSALSRGEFCLFLADTFSNLVTLANNMARIDQGAAIAE